MTRTMPRLWANIWVKDKGFEGRKLSLYGALLMVSLTERETDEAGGIAGCH